MMLIICDKRPSYTLGYLVEKTNKNFVFKQLLELGQLICSADISKVFKPLQTGKELQQWIKDNPYWTWRYFKCLFSWCKDNINLSFDTFRKFQQIDDDLELYIYTNGYRNLDIPSVIFRYKKGYECEYKTNSELPIGVGCRLYKDYIKWKFKTNLKEKANV